MTKLQLLTNIEDRIALRYWLGIGDKRWRQNQYAALRSHCEQNDLAPVEVLSQLVTGQLQLAGLDQLIARYIELQAEISRLTQLSVTELFDELFPAGMEWADPIRELVVGKLIGVDAANELVELLKTEITQPEMPCEGDYVRIMSLHKSKGLTSRATIIVGCMRGLIPFIDKDLEPAERPLHFQEQRRLFYVALTRAKELLVISSAASVPRAIAHHELSGVVLRGGNYESGRTISCEFLHELGPSAPPAQSGVTWQAGGFQ